MLAEVKRAAMDIEKIDLDYAMFWKKEDDIILQYIWIRWRTQEG